MELKHYTSAEIFANMNETCDLEYSLTVIMKPDRILRKLTYRQHRGSDTL